MFAYLAQRFNVDIPAFKKRFLQLAALCGKEANRRKLPEGEEAFWWAHEWHALQSIIARLVG